MLPGEPGTVTFLLSDFEESGKLDAVADAHAILDRAVVRHDGVRPLEGRERDGVVASFSRAADAVAAALDAQVELRAHDWPDEREPCVRIALHTADAQLRDRGVALSRCTCLRAIAHGGQTLLSRATRDLVVDQLPDGLALVDCGSHRLRDLGRPEHVYAFAHPDLPAADGPLRSLDAFPNNLPDQLTSFVGRAREMEDLREALSETRLMTLTGAGGAGKTRLALQCTADALERFPDGAWWVELAPLQEPELVAEALAAAIGVRPLPGKTAVEASCMHLAERRALVVLDNCEHLLSACADLAEALLRECPWVSILATSRTPLGVGGETDWRVPSLSLPGAEPLSESAATLDQSDAVRLFIERARKARPNFAVTDDNAPAVAQICQDLDGLPLAIELAAARVRMLTVEQIAAGLSDRFHLLTGGARTALPRHQTLRASVDWSHDLLSEPERTLFRRLSVFAGGFTLDACERVGDGEGLERVAILDLLGQLVDKSLVVAEEHGPAVRYRLLETVRQYGAERLAEAGEQDFARDRHRDTFLALAEAMAPELESAGQFQALVLLDAEAGNFAAALERAADTDGERALRLCKALTYWWRLRSLFAAAERALERALAAADAAASPLRAYVLGSRAYLSVFAGSFETGYRCAEASVAMAEEVGADGALSRALNVRGLIRLTVDPAGSRPGSRRAAELAQAAGDNWSLLFARLNLGLSHTFCGENAEAQRIFDELLPAAEAMHIHEIPAWILATTGFAHLQRGETERALELAEQAATAADRVGDLVPGAIGVVLAANVDVNRGRLEAARASVEASRRRLIAAGAGLGLPYLESSLASIRFALGDHAGARTTLEGLIATGVDFGHGLASAIVSLADVLRVSGEATGADSRAREALEIAERIDSPFLVAMCKEVLGRLAAGRGDWSAGEALLHEALALRVDHEMPLYYAQTLDALAEVAAGLDSDEEAARMVGAADGARGQLGVVRWPPEEPRVAELERKLRARLGDQRFETAHAGGAALDLDEAVAWVRRARGERKRPARGWESLTPTELQVARLLAEGLTNPQIGERMFIARGTVKVHVSHIFQKLAMTSRAELAAEAARHGLAGPGGRENQL